MRRCHKNPHHSDYCDCASNEDPTERGAKSYTYLAFQGVEVEFAGVSAGMSSLGSQVGGSAPLSATASAVLLASFFGLPTLMNKRTQIS